MAHHLDHLPIDNKRWMNQPVNVTDGAQRQRIWHGQASTTYFLITVSLFNPIPQSTAAQGNERLALGV